jgi:hypothetical protein
MHLFSLVNVITFMTVKAWFLVLVGVIGIGSIVKTKGQNPSGPAWELASVSEVNSWLENGVQVSTVRICYHVADGCRWENMKAKGSTLAEYAQNDVSLGVAAATGKLAEAGWEPVAITVGRETNRDRILMKRRKQ